MPDLAALEYDAVHVYPENDVIEHTLNGGTCPCQPRQAYESYFRMPVFVHNLLKENPN